MFNNAVKETEFLSAYLAGIHTVTKDENFKKASEWLRKLASRVCGKGYIGCSGGEFCDSDHK